ncbi:cystathionine beta-lyase [Sphingosinicella sp.]|uniref:cystathionine beta-lyase n=1 Tax=Sphingosinicella sp. TaxID=1917971 RepID=UPI0025EEFB0C|nr:cystathionine beta-lyase [Sphingosinicella sp.]
MSGDEDDAPATKLVHAGRRPEWTHGVVNPPVYRASTCLFETLDAYEAASRNPDAGLYYGRRGTPTQWALAEALTEMEPGAAGTHLFPSGVAAIAAALIAATSAGDHVLMADNVYEPTRVMAKALLARSGIETEFYDPLIGADIAALIRPNTRVIYLESPGSLTFEVQDVSAIAALARARGILTILDNTWATPLLFPAIRHGVDLSVQSLTKYVVGHSDALMGSVTAAPDAWQSFRNTALRLGQTAAPDDCALALRGLRTLAIRMERHGKTALALAQALAAHPAVERVICPALSGDPGHALWTRDFSGYASLFAIALKPGSREALAACVDNLRHFGMGFSFGGYESLVLPVKPLRTATRWQTEGPMLRIHCGLEDADDLIADMTAGLDRYLENA